MFVQELLIVLVEQTIVLTITIMPCTKEYNRIPISYKDNDVHCSKINFHDSSKKVV